MYQSIHYKPDLGSQATFYSGHKITDLIRPVHALVKVYLC